MSHLEQAVADIFNSYMRDLCIDCGSKYHYFSLGGQDRDTGADYLVSNSNNFSLIEFKYSESELISEGKKSRREQLCLLLKTNFRMREIHDKCHFVAWSDSQSGQLHCAPYRTEICNRQVFPSSASLTRLLPLKKHRVLAETYARQFISPPPHRSIQKQEFEEYLTWLLQDTSGSGKTTVQLMVKAETGCAGVRFNSVNAAHKWMQEPKLKAQNTRHTKLGGRI